MREQPLWMPVSMVVATVLCIVGVFVFGTLGRRTSSRGVQRTYTTAPGQQATITLVDGSRALLGPATTLTVMTRPADASIDVTVIGQALFTVAHGHDTPFRVRAGHAVAQVLGTTFLVRQYATDHVARVVVTDGRVSLTGMRGAAIVGTRRVLAASTLGTVDDSGQVRVTPNIAVEDYTSWTQGQLVFRRTPARDAVIELGRAYGVEIRVADSALAAHPISWTVTFAQRSLTDVLESLAEGLGAHAVRTGHVITLVPGRPASSRPAVPRFLNRSESQYGR